jgi:hypothetical protein
VMTLVVWPIRESLVAIPAGIVAYGLAAILTGAISVRDLVVRLRSGRAR